MVKSTFDSRSLLIQMISAFIIIVMVTSVTVGLPAIILLQNQIDRQAWAQVEQGQRATIALYASYYKEILNLATLTGQRPTLQELMIRDDIMALTDYLITLQIGAGLDGIVVCDSRDKLVATTNPLTGGADCKIWKTGKYNYDPGNHSVCMTAFYSIENQNGNLGDVIVCRKMDDDFEIQLRDQTGLEHILWIDENPISTSITGGIESLESIRSQGLSKNGQINKRFFEIDGTPYYATDIILDQEELKAQVALNVTDIVTIRTQLVRILIASILGITLTGSLLGVFLAQRISQPLVRLSEAAASFSLGDLETPLVTETRVREITKVARALESARVDLLATLTSLQSERDWSEHLLASIVEGIITLDADGRITFFSHGAERVTGWNKNEVIGREVDDVFHLVGSESSFSSILPSIQGSRQRVDVMLANDMVASLAITGARLTRSGESKTETAVVFRDISEEEAVHRLLGQFMANVAHEFRTPLSALEASIELLLDQAPYLNADELHELHTSLHLGILGLHTLVDNLLESANIEARRFTISTRSSDLGKIIVEAVNTMKPLLNKYEQKLTVELPVHLPNVLADPRRTVQVLINLLSNASRYGPPGEEIILKATTDKQFARIEIIDRGPGIPPEHRANIFRRFVFPHAEDAISQAGAGLGLSVVKAIITAHDGQVGVDNHPSGGSIFWFTLPTSEESP